MEEEKWGMIENLESSRKRERGRKKKVSEKPKIETQLMV
jgi:hypothetical protein